MSAFDELVAHPGVGRLYEQAIMPGLADAAPGGRVRLDALARWLQDVALADVVDAGVGETALWVVRRSRLAVARFPRFGEAVTLRTLVQRRRAHVGPAPHDRDHARGRPRRGRGVVGPPRPADGAGRCR